MTTIRRDAHLTQLMELVEVITIMSCLALFTDFVWCIHDITINGCSTIMVMIVSSLLTAFVITFLALYRYHRLAVKRILKERMIEKLKICKKCAKHRSETSIKRKGA